MSEVAIEKFVLSDYYSDYGAIVSFMVAGQPPQSIRQSVSARLNTGTVVLHDACKHSCTF